MEEDELRSELDADLRVEAVAVAVAEEEADVFVGFKSEWRCCKMLLKLLSCNGLSSTTGDM